MNTALITGASGFIGGHLAESLHTRGIRTRCLLRSSSSRDRLQASGSEIVTGDMTDADSLRRAVAGVDVVFHLAGKTCALRREELFRVNGQACHDLAAACAAQANPPVLVQISSIAASGPAGAGRPRTESDPPRPVSQYGRSKLAGEAAVRAFSHHIPITVLRPGVVFGEFDPGMRMVAKSIKHAGLHLNAGIFSPRLSMIYVRDLVNLMIAAAERGERLEKETDDQRSSRGIYFAACCEYPTYVELGRWMAPELIDSKFFPWTIRLPGPAAFVLGIVNEGISWYRGKPDIFSRDKVREALVPSWACSCEKIVQHFQWRPGAPLIDQLRATARWYLEQGWV